MSGTPETLVTTNTVVTTEISGDDDEDIIVISLSVIVAVIVVIAIVFLARLLCIRSKKIEVRHGQPTTDGRNVRTMDSQPTMDKQFVADRLDMMELTKNAAKGQYGSLRDDSLRSNSQRSRVNSARGGTPQNPNERATIEPPETEAQSNRMARREKIQVE